MDAGPRNHERGDVVGAYSTGSTFHGFLWREGVFTTFDFPGAVNTSIQDIGPRGEIVGYYVLGSSVRGFAARIRNEKAAGMAKPP